MGVRFGQSGLNFGDVSMKERTLTIPDLALIAGTRIALGAGIGLLLADKLNEDNRKGAGWALLTVGVLTTIPLVMNVLGKSSVSERISE
jgi:multisubunit Na+/H+ antiporter MnhB subunit